jgi:hypothetical protein
LFLGHLVPAKVRKFLNIFFRYAQSGIANELPFMLC